MIAWWVLTAFHLVRGYVMPRFKGFTYIVNLHLHFLCIFFFTHGYMISKYSNPIQVICKHIYWPMDETQTDTTIHGQSEHGSKDMEGILHTLQSPRTELSRLFSVILKRPFLVGSDPSTKDIVRFSKPLQLVCILIMQKYV